MLLDLRHRDPEELYLSAGKGMLASDRSQINLSLYLSLLVPLLYFQCSKTLQNFLFVPDFGNAEKEGSGKQPLHLL